MIVSSGAYCVCCFSMCMVFVVLDAWGDSWMWNLLWRIDGTMCDGKNK